MPNKHEAILPDGSVAKRKSQNRVYTHCVAVRGCYDYALKSARTPGCSDADNFRFHKKIVDGTSDFLGPRDWEKTPEQLARRERDDAASIERSKVELNGCADAESYVAMKVAQRVAAVEKRKAEGGYEKWGVEGWNGRLELAQKLAAQMQGKAYIAEVQIIEAKIV